MGLFGGGPPKQIKQLDEAIFKARTAFSVIDSLPDANKQVTIAQAPQAVVDAAVAAAKAGYPTEVREAVTTARANPPGSSADILWDELAEFLLNEIKA